MWDSLFRLLFLVFGKIMKQSDPSDLGPDEIAAITSSRDLKHADYGLVKRFLSVKKEFERDFPDLQLGCSCTYRSTEAQCP